MSYFSAGKNERVFVVDIPFRDDVLYVMGAPEKLTESAKLFSCEGG